MNRGKHISSLGKNNISPHDPLIGPNNKQRNKNLDKELNRVGQSTIYNLEVSKQTNLICRDSKLKSFSTS